MMMMAVVKAADFHVRMIRAERKLNMLGSVCRPGPDDAIIVLPTEFPHFRLILHIEK